MSAVRNTFYLILVLIALMVWIERAEWFSFLDREPSVSVISIETAETSLDNEAK